MRSTPLSCLAVALVLMPSAATGAEITSAQVNTAIANGVSYLEKRQEPSGGWSGFPNEPGGVTALCTLALLSCGRTADDPSVRNALDYLGQLPSPERTYSTALRIMAFGQANPAAYAAQIQTLAAKLETFQLRNSESKGGWSYGKGIAGAGDQADNSNTQFAILALHEAERAGAKVSDQTWQLALNYWTQPKMQHPDGAFGYHVGTEVRGSMTCAGIASLMMARDRLGSGDATIQEGRLLCCGNQEADDSVKRALEWMGRNFSVQRHPGSGGSQGFMLYYLYALQRVGRMSGQRFIGGRDWYQEGCAHLLTQQDPVSHAWRGNGVGESQPQVGTSLALLFLSSGRRPVVIGRLKYQNDDAENALDWNHHRQAVQNLTLRIEKEWKRDLSWQTIDISTRTPPADGKGKVSGGQRAVTTADLLEAPVLFLSGTQALSLDAQQKQSLKEYIENGAFLFAEACNGNGCSGETFDRSFRALLQELFPDSTLRKLPPDHPVSYAQAMVDPKHLPQDPEFSLWGLDTCCRTTVIYSPRSLSCYWALAHPYRETTDAAALMAEVENVVRIGINVVTYATGRELKEKLERPQLSITKPSDKSPSDALLVPKLSHTGGADDAPNALNNLLSVVGWRFEMPINYEKRLISPSDPKLLEYPIAFIHGRRAFRFSDAERKGLKAFLDGGGFIFADAICASQEFANSFRAELKIIYPQGQFSPIPMNHPIFTDTSPGFALPSVMLRDPQVRKDDDPVIGNLTQTTPVLESLTIAGRLAVVLSPNDISCAVDGGASLMCKGYIPVDAARLGANVLLYALKQKVGRLR